PEEWRRVRDLRLRALEDSPDAFGSLLERERDHVEADWMGWISGWGGGRNRLFVAALDGEWVGMAVGSKAADDPIAHLYGMWVEPRMRGTGLGGRLIEAVVAWVASLGVAEIELAVTETNDTAGAFYEARGFVDTGARQPLRVGSPLRVIVMRRRVPIR
ncbi:MAG: GNAT family N-acetyltransferase, partial [Actinomycetota bacterium]